MRTDRCGDMHTCMKSQRVCTPAPLHPSASTLRCGDRRERKPKRRRSECQAITMLVGLGNIPQWLSGQMTKSRGRPRSDRMENPGCADCCTTRNARRFPGRSCGTSGLRRSRGTNRLFRSSSSTFMGNRDFRRYSRTPTSLHPVTLPAMPAPSAKAVAACCAASRLLSSPRA